MYLFIFCFKNIFKTKMNYNFCEPMLSETHLPYFTLIPLGKLALKDIRSSGTHPSHMLIPHCVTGF